MSPIYRGRGAVKLRRMRRLLLLPFLLVLSLDFTTLEAPLVPQGSRHVEADDEEESVPSRLTRVRRATPPVTATLPGHRYVALPQVQRRPDRIGQTIRPNDPPPWTGPIVQGRLASAGPASPPEDH